MQPASEIDTEGRELAQLVADFPGFRIWREDVCGRVRYIALSQHPDLRPHTVITADLAELREALARGQRVPGWPQPTFSPAAPSVARIYDHVLGGKDHFPADRAAARELLERFPEVAQIARANRAFLARAVRHVARQQVTQFVDLGAGLPASPNVHETTRQVIPGARVAYVDNDPMVLAHARAVLAVDDQVAVVAGDLRAPAAVLADPALISLIDFSKPVCVVLASVLHFLPAQQADAAVAAFREQMSPGSYLVISVGTSSGTDPELIRCLQATYAGTAPVTARTEAEITSWFDGLLLARPGLTDVWAWRAGQSRQAHRPPQSRARFVVGVARKPSGAGLWRP